MSDPRAMLAALGEPTKAGLDVLHRSDTLTIFAATWTRQMSPTPHNHLMWALTPVLGVSEQAAAAELLADAATVLRIPVRLDPDQVAAVR